MREIIDKEYRELDILAKANNVTMTGCGYQDVFWGNLISILGGATFKITEIKTINEQNCIVAQN